LAKEKDEMKIIVNKNLKKTGALKKEEEFFNEFQQFSEEEEEESQTTNIISFEPSHIEESKKSKLPMKLAAASEAVTETSRIKSDFYYHPSKNIALKIIQKNKNQVYATVIAESDMDLTDAVILCKEIDKYSIAGCTNEYFIGSYDKFDVKKFNFDLIFPFNKLTIFQTGENHGHFLEKPDILIDYIKTTEDGLKIKLVSKMEIKIVVMKAGSYKDFINIKEGIINIPKVLMEDKIDLMFY
jgi:hypothetical protein